MPRPLVWCGNVDIKHRVFRLRLIVHTVETRNVLQEAMEVRVRTEEGF